MTFNTLIHAHRLPGVTPAEFREHYDKIHIPMIRSMTGPHFPLRHIRKYIERSSGGSSKDATATVLAGSQADFDFDVVAEMVFETQEAFETFCAILGQEENARRIDEDERTFLDRGRVRMAVLGETDVTEREG